jgi:hypothetical protein
VSPLIIRDTSDLTSSSGQTNDLFGFKISENEVKPNHFNAQAFAQVKEPIQMATVVEQVLPSHLFTWKYGGNNAFIAGTFTDWKQL